MVTSNLTAIEFALGNIDQAHEHSRLAYFWGSEAYGENDPSLSSLYVNMGLCSEAASGSLRKCIQFLSSSKDVNESNLGTRHPVLMYPYLNLAAMNHRDGNLEEYENFIKLALSIGKEKLGEEHILTQHAVSLSEDPSKCKLYGSYLILLV